MMVQNLGMIKQKHDHQQRQNTITTLVAMIKQIVYVVGANRRPFFLLLILNSTDLKYCY